MDFPQQHRSVELRTLVFVIVDLGDRRASRNVREVVLEMAFDSCMGDPEPDKLINADLPPFRAAIETVAGIAYFAFSSAMYASLGLFDTIGRPFRTKIVGEVSKSDRRNLSS
jgi:hypothetical protein